MFPSFGKVVWKANKSIAVQINEYIDKLGDNFESIVTGYFDEFKKVMKKRVRIPISLVEKHEKNICFLVDIDYTYIQAIVPRVRWLKPLGYELYIDDANVAITAFLAEEVDKSAKPFGTYEQVRVKIIADKKMSSAMKKKDKLVKKIKDQFGIGEEEIEEEEDEEEVEEIQGPLALTQGLGEDVEEEVEETEKEKGTPEVTKKRKAKAPPIETPKPKKAGKPSPAKPNTRETTRTQKAKEQEKEKPAEVAEPKKKRQRRKYVASPDSDEEEEDARKLQVVSDQKPTIDNICNNIEKNADLTKLKDIEFSKLTKAEQDKIENSIYAMMIQFKVTPIELDNSIPKDLYSLIENKWHYCLNIEKEIRESTLAELFPEMKKGQITVKAKKFGTRFSPRDSALSILKNHIEEVVQKNKDTWKIIFGLKIPKEGQEQAGTSQGGEEEEMGEEDEKEEEDKEEKEKEEEEKEEGKGDEEKQDDVMEID